MIQFRTQEEKQRSNHDTDGTQGSFCCSVSSAVAIGRDRAVTHGHSDAVNAKFPLRVADLESDGVPVCIHTRLLHQDS